MLNEVPMRGAGTPMPPTDPLIYRFYELVMVNGPAWKALIEEEFGDGIMSAIDFDMTMERLRRPEGRPRQDHACRASSCRSSITARRATRRRRGIRRSRGRRRPTLGVMAGLVPAIHALRAAGIDALR